MKQFTYTTINGYKETVKAQNITELYEKIKGNYRGEARTLGVSHEAGEILLPKPNYKRV